MVFAPKKLAQDIGWGSRRANRTKVDDALGKETSEHWLKAQLLTRSKNNKCLKRRERSNSDEAFDSVIGENCAIEESKIKKAKDNGLGRDELSHYYGNQARANLPLRGGLLPEVELDSKKNSNTLSTILTMHFPTTFAFVGRANVVALEGSIEN